MQQFRSFSPNLKASVAVRLLHPFCSAYCMCPIDTNILSTALLPLCMILVMLNQRLTSLL